MKCWKWETSPRADLCADVFHSESLKCEEQISRVTSQTLYRSNWTYLTHCRNLIRRQSTWEGGCGYVMGSTQTLGWDSGAGVGLGGIRGGGVSPAWGHRRRPRWRWAWVRCCSSPCRRPRSLCTTLPWTCRRWSRSWWEGARSLWARLTGAPSRPGRPPPSPAGTRGGRPPAPAGSGRTCRLLGGCTRWTRGKQEEEEAPATRPPPGYTQRHTPQLPSRRTTTRTQRRATSERSSLWPQSRHCGETEETRVRGERETDSLFTVFSQTLGHASWMDHSRVQRRGGWIQVL